MAGTIRRVKLETWAGYRLCPGSCPGQSGGVRAFAAVSAVHRADDRSPAIQHRQDRRCLLRWQTGGHAVHV